MSIRKRQLDIGFNPLRREQKTLVEAPRMEGKRRKKQDASAQTERTAKVKSATRATTQAGVRAEAIFGYLAQHPDIAELMQEYPHLTSENLRAYFAGA